MNEINTNGTSLRGHFQMPYAKLVELIGEPNSTSDGVVATIYNWKNGPNYIGRGTIKDIDEWNVGGHSGQAMDVVSLLLKESTELTADS